MIALLDINLLIALFDAAHVHHKAAHAWMTKNRSRGWATCPITQNGCVRVMSHQNYPGHLPVAEIARRFAAAVDVPEHTFWSDSISLCDAGRFHPDRILTPRTLTDIYLLGLAKENGGRLVTFDRSIQIVRGSGCEGATPFRAVEFICRRYDSINHVNPKKLT